MQPYVTPSSTTSVLTFTSMVTTADFTFSSNPCTSSSNPINAFGHDLSPFLTNTIHAPHDLPSLVPQVMPDNRAVRQLSCFFPSSNVLWKNAHLKRGKQSANSTPWSLPPSRLRCRIPLLTLLRSLRQFPR